MVKKAAVETRELGICIKDLHEVEKKIMPQTEKGLWSIKGEVVRAAKMRANVDSGRLRESITGKWRERSGNIRELSIDAEAIRAIGGNAPFNYAYAQEYGFAPHTFHISTWNPHSTWRPDVGMLHRPEQGFVTVGTRGKGTSWRPFLRPAINKALPFMEQKIARRLDVPLKKFGKR